MVCKFCGGNDVQVTPRTITCNRCHMSFDNTGEGKTAKKRGGRRASSQNETTNTEQGQSAKKIPITTGPPNPNAPTYLRIHDTITTYNEDGDVEHVETVQDIDFKVFAPKYIPDLTINANFAEFLKWRFANQVKRDKRWGRDNLRRRGFSVVATVEDRGKEVKVYRHADDTRDVFDFMNEDDNAYGE